MKTVKELKQSVSQRLRYCWGENAAIFFITAGGMSAIALAWFMVTDFLISLGIADSSTRRIDLSNGVIFAVTAVSLLILFGIAEPFRYGVIWYRLQQVRGNSVHARSIFGCYSSWKRAWQVFRLDAYLFVRRLYFVAPLTALLAAGIIILNRIGAAENNIAYSAAATLVLMLAGSVICAAAAFNCKYAPTAYLFVLNLETPPKKLVEKSIEISKGKSDYLIEAILSSAVWLPSCLIVFPMVFAVPYMQMVYTAAVNEMILSAEDTHEQDGQDGVTADSDRHKHEKEHTQYAELAND